eukprot:TRINITY_DN36661_c0_g1_i1.p2 TRINITY_DN36661_c0_g1~~TRINITY_DN36661_c0_g1_i1.p2  ORF type:complete len:221 (-),score=49.78 TRINITY_DN36661_c0_g1_i1:24-686(-)
MSGKVRVVSPPPSRSAAGERPKGTFVQCKKCGHVPGGCPALLCVKCKTCGDNWQPKPMTRVVETRAKIEKALQATKQAAADGRAKRKQLTTIEKNTADRQREVERLQTDAAMVESSAEAMDLSHAPDGPETRARKSTLVQNVGDRRQKLRVRVANTRQRQQDADEAHEAAQRRIAELRRRQDALARERQQLADDAAKVAAILTGGGAAAAPADVAALFAR